MEAATLPPTPTVTTQKCILFVDDDPEFLRVIERVMRLWSNNGLDVMTAPSASSALAMMQEHLPDLVVMDVCMPVVDGLQFLSMLNRRYPELKKVVLTGNPDDVYRQACLQNGAELFLEKPRSADGFETIFTTLEELTRWKKEAGFRGVLRSVGLTDVIQMECIARNSSLLTVASSELSGMIYIREGSIVHAEAGGEIGEAAFKRLIALESGDFRSQPYCVPPEESIQTPWEALLMDAAQAKDEFLGEKAVQQQAEPNELEPLQRASASIPEEKAYQPIEIDEMLICSAGGDVFHSWQCENSELRISLLGFLRQRARLLQETVPLGDFDRAEFIATGSRLVAQLRGETGVIVRSSLAGTAVAKNDPLLGLARTQSTPQMKTKASEWFQSSLNLPGLFVAMLQFPDRTGTAHSRAPQFTAEVQEVFRRAAADNFQVLKLQRFHAQRARWKFEQVIVECTQWPDGTFLAMVFSRRPLEMNSSIVEEQINTFLAQDFEMV